MMSKVQKDRDHMMAGAPAQRSLMLCAPHHFSLVWLSLLYHSSASSESVKSLVREWNRSYFHCECSKMILIWGLIFRIFCSRLHRVSVLHLRSLPVKKLHQRSRWWLSHQSRNIRHTSPKCRSVVGGGGFDHFLSLTLNICLICVLLSVLWSTECFQHRVTVQLSSHLSLLDVDRTHVCYVGEISWVQTEWVQVTITGQPSITRRPPGAIDTWLTAAQGEGGVELILIFPSDRAEERERSSLFLLSEFSQAFLFDISPSNLFQELVKHAPSPEVSSLSLALCAEVSNSIKLLAPLWHTQSQQFIKIIDASLPILFKKLNLPWFSSFDARLTETKTAQVRNTV